MRKLLIGAAAIGLVATGAVAGAVTSVVAQQADTDIHACVARGGSVRIVAVGESCKTSPSSQAETPLSWPSTDADTDTHLDFAGTIVVSASENVLPGELGTLRVSCPPEHLIVPGELSATGASLIFNDAVTFVGNHWEQEVGTENTGPSADFTTLTINCVPQR